MNILLGLMGLDIGGAETHVVTLAQALRKNGHSVVVVSSGGIYEEAITKHGISHVYGPLDQKSPRAVAQSIMAMKKAIEQYDVEIVHTHGRIPSLIGGIVSKMTRRKFMTTVHAMHKLDSYKWLTLFGQETICISEDIRNHIIHHYKVSDDQITVIPNCIDTKKFAPKVVANSEVFTIGYISRMEETLAERAVKVAEMVTHYAYRSGHSLRLLLVGDGADFNRVVAQINQLSKEIADRYQDKKIEIQLLGKRTDIPEILNTMDAVVCVSRVAMEAMSCGKPVILLGGEGYEGLLTKENYTHAKGSNFTGRTSDMVFEEAEFLKDVEALIGDEEKRKNLGNWGRQQIESAYSVDEVAERTIQLYEALGGK